jgi:preprotein translocase subunit SecA
VSLEDELLKRHSPVFSGLLPGLGRDGEKEISSPLARRAIDLAQRIAERESFRRRRQVLANDHWIEENMGFADKVI